MKNPRKVGAAVEAMLAAVVSLLVMLLLLGGPAHFVELVRGAALHFAVISLIAGTAGALFGRSRGISVLCGIVIAGIGYAVVFFYAVSRI